MSSIHTELFPGKMKFMVSLSVSIYLSIYICWFKLALTSQLKFDKIFKETKHNKIKSSQYFTFQDSKIILNILKISILIFFLICFGNNAKP